MKLEQMHIDDLAPAAYNPRVPMTPGTANYEALDRSLEEFGLVVPIIYNRRTGHVVSGHQRLRVLRNRGEERIDVVVVDLPIKREKALNLALNRIRGFWDFEKLTKLLGELQDIDPDLVELAGFPEREVEILMEQFQELDLPAGPQAPGPPPGSSAGAPSLNAGQAAGPQDSSSQAPGPQLDDLPQVGPTDILLLFRTREELLAALSIIQSADLPTHRIDAS